MIKDRGLPDPAALLSGVLGDQGEDPPGWQDYQGRLQGRLEDMIDREDEDLAKEMFREFLLRDPLEEPLELLDLPKDRWAEMFVGLSPSLHLARLKGVSPEDLRPATRREVRLIKKASLEEWLGLLAETAMT